MNEIKLIFAVFNIIMTIFAVIFIYGVVKKRNFDIKPLFGVPLFNYTFIGFFAVIWFTMLFGFGLDKIFFFIDIIEGPDITLWMTIGLYMSLGMCVYLEKNKY